MSLDVYLEIEVDTGGNEPHVVELYNADITHNLGKMAAEAGIYECCWRPEENGIETAAQMIEPLKGGLQALRSDPEHYRTFDASNGWGRYDDFVPWLACYLDACEEHPKAKVRAWR